MSSLHNLYELTKLPQTELSQGKCEKKNKFVYPFWVFIYTCYLIWHVIMLQYRMSDALDTQPSNPYSYTVIAQSTPQGGAWKVFISDNNLLFKWAFV